MEQGTRKTWAEMRTEAEDGQGGQEAGWEWWQSVLHDASDGFSGCRGRALPRTRPCRREGMPLSSGHHHIDFRDGRYVEEQKDMEGNTQRTFYPNYQPFTQKNL